MPTWPLEPILLTEVEAALLLRLIDDSDDAEAARRRINRLVDQGKLRPCLVGGRRCYALEELRRFARDETEKYGVLR
jgi:hypothetical protein